MTYKVFFAVVNCDGLMMGLRWGSETRWSSMFSKLNQDCQNYEDYLDHQNYQDYLEGGDVECCHVILATTLVLVVDYVFSHVVVWARVLDLSLPPSVVNNKDQHQNCKNFGELSDFGN